MGEGGITPTYDWAVKNAHIKNAFVRETLAELFGTWLLLFFVTGAGFYGVGHHDSHAVGVFGVVFGLMTSILIVGGISGAHINPAVSLGLAVAGHLKWAKLPFYWVAQMLGGYLGCLVSYAIHKDYLRDVLQIPKDVSIPDADTGLKILGSMCSTGYKTQLGIAFLTEIMLTGILLMAVMGVIDKGNMKVPVHLVAFLLALVVAALGMGPASVTGAMLNPARDLTPRLAAWSLGWKNDDCFRNINYYDNMQEWWVVGTFATPLGAVIGVLLYNFLIGAQLTNNRDELEYPSVNENGDWRNTQFIPRTQVPQQPQPPNYNMAPVNGHYNPAFINDGRVLKQY